MADLRMFSHEFLIEFIDLYRENECLWKIKSKEYSDRNRKSQAYNILIGKLKEVEPDTDRDAVIKKINTMRSSWRKEFKKEVDSRKSGAGEEDVYKPHLWYYKYFAFLKDQEVPRPSVSNIEAEIDDNHQVRLLFQKMFFSKTCNYSQTILKNSSITNMNK